MSDYDDYCRCIKCDGKNKITDRDYINHTLAECDTECDECGHKDYWAYGFYMSRSDSLTGEQE